MKYSWEREILSVYNKILKSMPVADCHVHIGVDEDGEKASAETIIKQMDEMNVSVSSIFPFSDPERGKDFHLPNERVLEASKKYPKRFIPFFRIDPKGPWKKEFNLRVEQGFVGVKLHPSRQKFMMDSKKSVEVFRRAGENNLVVLCHTGLGMVNLAKQVRELVKKVPEVKIILGHAAFVDMDNVIKIVKDMSNIYFDTSAIRTYDLYNLINQIPSDRILFGSDYPFYNYPLSLEMLLHTCLTYKKPINSIKRMLGENLLRIVKNSDLFDKKKIMRKYERRAEKIEKKKFTLYDIGRKTTAPFYPLKEFIQDVSSRENRERTNKITNYLKIYTLLNSAEVLLTKNSYKRSFYRLKLIRDITKDSFDRKEEEHTKLINKTVNNIIRKKKEIIPLLETETSVSPNFAKTNIRICKNICVLRMLQV